MTFFFFLKRIPISSTQFFSCSKIFIKWFASCTSSTRIRSSNVHSNHWPSPFEISREGKKNLGQSIKSNLSNLQTCHLNLRFASATIFFKVSFGLVTNCKVFKNGNQKHFKKKQFLVFFYLKKSVRIEQDSKKVY